MKRIIVLIAAVVLLLAGCTQVPVPTGTAPTLVRPDITPPEMVRATIGTFYDYYAAEATVAPYTQELYFDTSGVISNAYVYPGKMVKAGELLVELDHSALSDRIASIEEEISDTKATAAYTDRMAQLQIDILKVELLQLEDQLAAAEETDVSRLRQQVALKKNEIEQAKADLRHDQALREARLTPKQEELARLKNERKLYFLYAPFDGVIAYDIQLHPGYPANQSEPVIALSDASRMVLDVKGYFSEETEASAQSVVARIGDTDYAIKRIPPTEQELFYAAQNNTQPNSLFEILGTEEDLAKLEFGQYASIGVTHTYEENVLLIPVNTAYNDPTGKIYVDVDVNGQRIKQIVEIGGHNSHSIWITSGLEEGAYVYVREE